MKESKKYLPRSLILAMSVVVVVAGIALAANSATTVSLIASPTPVPSHAVDDVYWLRCHSTGFEVTAYPSDVSDQCYLRYRCGRCDLGGGSRLSDRNSGAWVDRLIRVRD